jgi:hypothetical protein
LDDSNWGFEIKFPLATLLIDGVLPLRLNVVFEKGEAIDSLLITIDLVHVELLGFFIVKEILDILVRQVLPRLREGDDIIEPGDFAHRLLIIAGIVVFPESPLRGELKLLVQYFCEIL